MRPIAVILLVLVAGLVVAGIATSSYNAGLAQGLAQGGRVPAPGPYPGYPYGFYRPFGFGFFGFLWPLLFIVLLFALARQLFWRGPFWRGRGWDDPRGRGVPPWLDEWHRREHESGSNAGTA